jgi:hypothetical protein
MLYLWDSVKEGVGCPAGSGLEDMSCQELVTSLIKGGFGVDKMGVGAYYSV